jgi:hypothetical protein
MAEVGRTHTTTHKNRGALIMSDPKNLVIALLLIGVAVLGYLYYESQQTHVRIDVPGFKLEAK